jgi:hypothetical protein
MVMSSLRDELQRALATPPVNRQQWAQYQKAARRRV